MNKPNIRKINSPQDMQDVNNYTLDAARRPFMYGKIHRVTVTEACLDYVGSITIDRSCCVPLASCRMLWLTL